MTEDGARAVQAGWGETGEKPPSRSQSVLDIDRAIKFRSQVVGRSNVPLWPGI
jgi:hypothetical protein